MHILYASQLQVNQVNDGHLGQTTRAGIRTLRTPAPLGA